MELNLNHQTKENSIHIIPCYIDPASSLLDLAGQSLSLHPPTQTKDPSTEILDEELLALGTHLKTF